MGQEKANETRAVEISICAVSDVGRVRKNNEDNFIVFDLAHGKKLDPPTVDRYTPGDRGLLLMVADGMGGEACGEVASQMAVTEIPPRFREKFIGAPNSGADAFVSSLAAAIEEVNRAIYEKAQGNPSFKGMGTTVTAVGVLGGTIFIGQVGDSRAYLVRNGAIMQLTRDQTFLNYLADLGADLPPDPETDHRRSILTQAVGASASVEVKLTLAELRQRDRVLICSDGLYSMVKGPQIEKLVTTGELRATCQALVDAANANGGTDNITSVLAEFSGSGIPPADSSPPPPAREYHSEETKP